MCCTIMSISIEFILLETASILSLRLEEPLPLSLVGVTWRGVIRPSCPHADDTGRRPLLAVELRLLAAICMKQSNV